MEAKADWVGAGVPFYNIDAATAKGGAAPKGITPLPRDIFTSDDFYVDRELWRDPRYFRCNSTLALDSQWGDYSSAPKYIKDDPATGAWGHCDVDYGREHIVSPYPFTTAQAHYEALLAEARAKGGPTHYSREHMPPNWEGRYTNNVSVVFGFATCGEETGSSAGIQRAAAVDHRLLQSDADDSLLADAGVSAAARPAALSPGARSRAAMVG